MFLVYIWESVANLHPSNLTMSTPAPLEKTPSRIGDDTVTASPNLKPEDTLEKKSISEKDTEKGVLSSKPVDATDLITGKTLAIVWTAFLMYVSVKGDQYNPLIRFRSVLLVALDNTIVCQFVLVSLLSFSDIP